MEPKDEVIELGMQQMALAPQAEAVRKKMADRLRAVGDYCINAVQDKINEGEFLTNNSFECISRSEGVSLTFNLKKLCDDGLRSEVDKHDQENWFNIPDVVSEYVGNYFVALGWGVEVGSNTGRIVLYTGPINEDLM